MHLLLVYGWHCGFFTIPALAWWLLLPFVMQDGYDSSKKKTV